MERKLVTEKPEYGEESGMIEIIREKSHEKYDIDDLSGEHTLLALLQEKGIAFGAPCGGRGICGKCRVKFLAGAPDAAGKERELLDADELENGIRLACVARVKNSCRILLPRSDEEDMAVLTDYGVQTENMESQKHPHIRSDIKKHFRYGIAIDVGTTTLAAELFDMSDGRTLAVASGINHQRVYGADVITRIAATNAGKGGLLYESIRADIVMLLEKLSEKVPLREVSEIAIVGNTTMCHLLRGLSCTGLGRAPFTPTDNTWYETDAKTLLKIQNCPAKVTILPGISAFVGADIVAGIYASGIDTRQEAGLLLDIGTNGEMALHHAGRLYVTSTAAGPVFEGGNISCGMPGVPGAVYRIRRQNAEDGWYCETIEHEPPVGLCGTGIIDLTAALRQADYMDENGTLTEPWFSDGILIKDHIRFEQSDIREVQMGKAAIRAGIEILLTETKCVRPEVSLAGGFGYFMDVEHAIQIGMFPEAFRGRVSSVGNSALKGAKQYLLDEENARVRIDRMLEHAVEWNLAEHPSFEALYLHFMGFK